MLTTSARLLRLLSLLQVAQAWPGAVLADRLSVSTRTVRADVERLRSLGYPVEAVPGRGGGYRLGAGAVLPPLLFDDDEALAVALALRAAPGVGAGLDDSARRALAKLQQVLPSRLRHRLETVLSSVETSPGPAVDVDAEALAAVAHAIRARERLRFDHVGRDGGPGTRRSAEPYRLVHAEGRWYLAGWDDDRGAWRTYRFDRMRLRTPNGARFRPRAEPPGGFLAMVQEAVGTGAWRYRVRAVVAAPAAAVVGRLPAFIAVEAVNEASCAVVLGSDDPHQLALWLALLDADFTVPGSPQLAGPLRRVSERYARAAESAESATSTGSPG